MSFAISSTGQLSIISSSRVLSNTSLLFNESAIIFKRCSSISSACIRPSEKKKRKMFLVRISIKKRGERAGGFFCYLLFPIACFLYTLLPSPRDMLELLGQILIKLNIRY